jgi:hypothetical protein
MSEEIVPIERVMQRILGLRQQRVMLDRHLAEQFPEDFVFTLSREEIERISQTVTFSSNLK